MDNAPIPTRPLTSGEKLLKDKFVESIANQSDQMDKLGQQLIALELAIPGLYATVLKLTGAALSANLTLYLTFGCWFLALLFALLTLIPRKWSVNTGIMKQDPLKATDELGIEDFFNKTAQYKRNRLIASSLLFFVGTLSAAFNIF